MLLPAFKSGLVVQVYWLGDGLITQSPSLGPLHCNLSINVISTWQSRNNRCHGRSCTFFCSQASDTGLVQQAQTEVRSMLQIIENQSYACQDLSALQTLRRQLTSLCTEFSMHLAGLPRKAPVDHTHSETSKRPRIEWGREREVLCYTSLKNPFSLDHFSLMFSNFSFPHGLFLLHWSYCKNLW